MYVSDMRALSDSQQFFLVYPQGTKLVGLDTLERWSWTEGSQANDLDFIDTLTDELAKNYNIDENEFMPVGIQMEDFLAKN